MFLHGDAVDKLFGAYTSIGRFPPRQRPEDTRTCRAPSPEVLVVRYCQVQGTLPAFTTVRRNSKRLYPWLPYCLTLRSFLKALMYRQDATLSTSSTFLLHQSAQTGCHDALGNSALLLKSVENVYTKSMSQEESLQKLMREKERADDAQHRQKQENAKLREQLVTERGIRSADTSVKHEIAQHKLMMQQIMEQQGEVKSMHKKESTRVKHLQQSTAHHKALFLRMQKDLQWVQEKQADRKQLKKQNHELQLRLSTMEGKLRDAQQKTSALEQSSSRHDAEAQAQQKEGERVKDRLENALREAQLQASVHERLAKVACEEADTELKRAGELCARWEDEHKEKVGSPAFSLLAAPAKRVRPPPSPPPR